MEFHFLEGRPTGMEVSWHLSRSSASGRYATQTFLAVTRRTYPHERGTLNLHSPSLLQANGTGFRGLGLRVGFRVKGS